MLSIDYRDVGGKGYVILQKDCELVIREEEEEYAYDIVPTSANSSPEILAAQNKQKGLEIKALFDTGETSTKKASSGMAWRGQIFTIQKLRCLVCLAHGLTPRESAQKLSISYATMQAHVSSLRWKLRFNSNKEMIQILRESRFGKTLRLMELEK